MFDRHEAGIDGQAGEQAANRHGASDVERFAIYADRHRIPHCSAPGRQRRGQSERLEQAIKRAASLVTEVRRERRKNAGHDRFSKGLVDEVTIAIHHCRDRMVFLPIGSRRFPERPPQRRSRCSGAVAPGGASDPRQGCR